MLSQVVVVTNTPGTRPWTFGYVLLFRTNENEMERTCRWFLSRDVLSPCCEDGNLKQAKLRQERKEALHFPREIELPGNQSVEMPCFYQLNRGL